MPGTHTEAFNSWLTDVWMKLEAKMEAQCYRIGDCIPYISEGGQYKEDKGESGVSWWTNGFWPGMLWHMYNATNKTQYKLAAEGVERRLDRALEDYEGLHHDVGFMWLLSAVANYRLTGDKKARARGLHAASLLAGRYNPRGSFIRAWNGDCTGWIIVDCMMNLPLLYWASREINDPRLAYIAEEHANTTLRHIVRPDGSCNHIAILNPDNGDLLETPGGQGYEPGSSWSRGLAWALYGFALSYRHTGKTHFLDTAKQIAHYFIANVSATGYVPLVDFRAPEQPQLWDTTAGTCAASGLLEIAGLVGEHEQGLYTNAACCILRAIEEHYCNRDVDCDSIVAGGTVLYHGEDDEVDVPIIYGDYFFIESVLKLRKRHLLLW